MKIIFYDVEHGSCTHIITPNGKHILVDVGSKGSESIVAHIKNKYFRNNSNGKIDALIITHPHEDHIYDLPALYEQLSPKLLRRPREAFDLSISRENETHKKIVQNANHMNNNYNTPLTECENPFLSNNNGGVSFDFILPPSSDTTKDDLNTFSSIIVVTYEGYKFILTGDNPKNILQNKMDTNKDNIKQTIANATVLLAPHHGRVVEFCKDFFDCVNPILTVVSDKSIIHTTQEETSSIYKGSGTKLYDRDRYVLTTRNDGTITFEVSNSNNCTVSMNKEGY
ncbi:MAG: ComEC/Rec2 family competence protein [Bacteroidales bacterium]